MEGRNERNIASRAAAIVFGILAGFGGLIHGIGEVLQGYVKTRFAERRIAGLQAAPFFYWAQNR